MKTLITALILIFGLEAQAGIFNFFGREMKGKSQVTFKTDRVDVQKAYERLENYFAQYQVDLQNDLRCTLEVKAGKNNRYHRVIVYVQFMLDGKLENLLSFPFNFEKAVETDAETNKIKIKLKKKEDKRINELIYLTNGITKYVNAKIELEEDDSLSLEVKYSERHYYINPFKTKKIQYTCNF